MFLIGLDFDQTLVRFQVNVLDKAAHNLGIQYSKENVQDYWFSNLTEAHRREVFRLFEDPEFMQAVVPLEGVQKKLMEWRLQGHSMIIITARQPSVHKCTKDFIHRYFPMVEEVFFVGLKESKAKLMMESGINVWIDDAPHGIVCSLERGIPTYLISNEHTRYNYEARKLLSSAYVVKSVADIVLDKPCPWCGRLPKIIFKKPILDTKDFHIKFGCVNKQCSVRPETEGLLLESCICTWNSYKA